VSPATPFSDASLPNHTKMFELVHVVTSKDDFDRNRVVVLASQNTHYTLTQPWYLEIDSCAP
jgi:hypothetical protein